MDALPTELWTQITEEADTGTLLSLSTTCHVLSKIAQTNLYRKVKLLDNVSFSRSTLFAPSLSERPELAGFVRSLAMGLSSDAYDRYYPMKTYPVTQNPALAQLSSFVNIRTLRLTSFHIDPDFHDAIHSLPCLDSLTLHSCTANDAIFDAASQVNSRRVISDLSLIIYHAYADDTWAAYLHPGLRSLTLGGFTYGEEDIDLPEAGVFLVKHISLIPSLNNLVWCDHANSPQLIQFLNLSTEIRSVYLSAPFISEGYVEYVAQLSPTAIPKLKKYCGPAAYAEIFVRNRPVDNITITLERTTRVDVLDSLGHSSAAVRDLQLRILGDGKPIEHFLSHVPTAWHLVSNFTTPMCASRIMLQRG